LMQVPAFKLPACSRVTGNPESAGINRHVGVSKEGWRIQ
jgi:hypothetical protein